MNKSSTATASRSCSPTPPAAATTSPPWSCGTVSTPASRTGSATARTAGCGTQCQDLHTNRAWVELALTAANLTIWAQALCFTGNLRRLEPKRLRYRVLHVVGRLVTTGRRQILRLDMNWPWATDLAAAFNRLRTAPWPG